MFRFFTLAALVLCINASPLGNYVEQVQEKIDNRPQLVSSNSELTDNLNGQNQYQTSLSAAAAPSFGQVYNQASYKVQQSPASQQVSYQVHRYPQQVKYETIQSAVPEQVYHQSQAAPAQTFSFQSAPAQQLYQAPAQQLYQAPAQQYYQVQSQQYHQIPAQQVYHHQSAPVQTVYQSPAQQVYHHQMPQQVATYQYQAAPVVSYQQSAPVAPQVTVYQQQQPQTTSYTSSAQEISLPEVKTLTEQSNTAFSAPAYELNNDNSPVVHTSSYENGNSLSLGSNSPIDELPSTVPLKFKFGTTTINRAGTKY